MSAYVYIKHAADFLFALLLTVLTSWLMLLCALFIKLDDPASPVMYNALRIGRNLEPFTMYKFRTMKPAFEGVGHVSTDSLTAPGRFLRKFSLDELPQLLNILRGDMSFIGPRPLTQRYVPWYTAEQNRRHSVRPGLTGLAQVNGRVNLSWDRRFALDVQYVDKLSFKTDASILLKTIQKVFTGEDAMVDEAAGSDDYFDDFQKAQIKKGLVAEQDLISHAASVR